MITLFEIWDYVINFIGNITLIDLGVIAICLGGAKVLSLYTEKKYDLDFPSCCFIFGIIGFFFYILFCR